MIGTEIRTAGPGDTFLLCRLIRNAFQDVALRFGLTPENCPKHPSNYTEEWVQRDLERGITYYILSHGSGPAGCVAMEKADRNVCYLERLAVLPQKRRKGFGRLLVDHVIAQAMTSGAGEISIGIIAAQIELNHWYRKIGFIEEDTKEFPHLPFLVTFLSYQL